MIRNRLTDDERRRFETDGYLIISDVLGDATVTELNELAERLWHLVHPGNGLAPSEPRGRRWGRSATHTPTRCRAVGLGGPVEFQNMVSEPAYLNLIDNSVILPKVCGLLGWNIFLYHGILMVSPPRGGSANDLEFSWHQDSSRVNAELEGRPRARLSVKAAVFLTDLRGPNRGNMWVIPGSQVWNELPEGVGLRDTVNGAIPIEVPPGTVVIFDRRLWHSSSTNASDETRHVAFLGYSYRWMRPHERMDSADELGATDPVRRQLLGDGEDATGYYSPDDKEVPLKQLVEAAQAQW